MGESKAVIVGDSPRLSLASSVSCPPATRASHFDVMYLRNQARKFFYLFFSTHGTSRNTSRNTWGQLRPDFRKTAAWYWHLVEPELYLILKGVSRKPKVSPTGPRLTVSVSAMPRARSVPGSKVELRGPAGRQS